MADSTRRGCVVGRRLLLVEDAGVLQHSCDAGPGAVAFGRAIETLAADSAPVTTRMIRQAEWVAGVSFSDADRKHGMGSEFL